MLWSLVLGLDRRLWSAALIVARAVWYPVGCYGPLRALALETSAGAPLAKGYNNCSWSGSGWAGGIGSTHYEIGIVEAAKKQETCKW